ncbi:MAG: right-handed parallel beta-helix repeat-containing protein, partial [Thermoplasmata archaeon]|nr:right-handed parallel beta-helix repeat-containing protein [Thermoplasmata archaeon]
MTENERRWVSGRRAPVIFLILLLLGTVFTGVKFASGAEYSPKEVKAYHDSSYTKEAQWARYGEKLYIRAVNATSSSTPGSSDYMLLYVNSTSNSTGVVMNLTYSTDYYFICNLTLNSTTSSSGGGNYSIEVSGGGKVFIRDNSNRSRILYTIKVDGKAPTVSLNVQGLGFLEEDRIYLLKEDVIWLTASDDLSGVNTTTYSWDGGSFNDYNASSGIKPPATLGRHTLQVRVEDVATNIGLYNYTVWVSYNWTDGKIIGKNQRLVLTNQTVFVGNLTVRGTLILHSSNLIFVGMERWVEVLNGGFLGITDYDGNTSTDGDRSLITTKASSTARINYRPGSDGWINSTDIKKIGYGGVAIELWAPITLRDVKMNIKGAVEIYGASARIRDSVIRTSESPHSLHIDGMYRSFSPSLKVEGTDISGVAPEGVVVTKVGVPDKGSVLRYSGYASSENRSISYVNTFGSGEKLKFSYIFPIKSGAKAQVFYSTDGVTWSMLTRLQPTLTWREMIFNFSLLAGQNVEIAFYFDAPVNYSGSGYYITDPVVISPSGETTLIPIYGYNFTDVPSTMNSVEIVNTTVTSGENLGVKFTNTWGVSSNGLQILGNISKAPELLNVTGGRVLMKGGRVQGDETESVFGATLIGGKESTFTFQRVFMGHLNRTNGYLIRLFGGNLHLTWCTLDTSFRGVLALDGTLKIQSSQIYNITNVSIFIEAPSPDYRPAGRLPVEIYSSLISNGGDYGILLTAVNPTAEGGGFLLNTTTLYNTGRGGENPVVGIWVDPSMRNFTVKLEDVIISSCKGRALDISTPLSAVINKLRVMSHTGNGLVFYGGGNFRLTDVILQNISSTALKLVEASSLNANILSVSNVGEGLILMDDTTSDITSLTLNTSAGYGVRAYPSSSLRMSSSVIERCSLEGILVEEGASVNILHVTSSSNGAGVRLKDAVIDNIKDLRCRNNRGVGLAIMVGSHTYSHLTSGILNSVDGVLSVYNDKEGLLVEKSVTSSITFVIKNFTLHDNLLWDLKVDKNITTLLMPINAAFDGASMTFHGRMIVETSVNLVVRELTLRFIGENCGILVKSGGYMSLEGSSIVTATPDDPYTFAVYGGALLSNSWIKGAQSIYAFESESFILRGSSVEDSQGGVEIIKSTFTLLRTRIHGSEITGIFVYSSRGNIDRCNVESSAIGVLVKDIVEEVEITNTRFTGNVFGMKVQNCGDKLLNISRCEFLENEVSDIQVRSSVVPVYFSTIDEEKIAVLDSSSRVLIYYGLDLYLYDEVGGPLTATVDIDDISGTSYFSREVDGEITDIPLLSFVVTSSGASTSHQPYTIQVTKSGFEPRSETFEITSHMILVFTLNGHPTLISQIPVLSMYEDTPAIEILNLNNYVSDRDELSYEILPGEHIRGEVVDGVLSLYPLTENWFGTEDLTVIARDSFGSSISFVITVNCMPVNDPPIYTNLTITPSTPITGDTLQASMVYYDPDGDPEPQTLLIQWYRNGEIASQYSGQREVPNVKFGERWYFEIRAWDGHSARDNGYGEVYRSEEIVVGNYPPVINSVKILEQNPDTTTDLHVVVEDYYDPDSPMVEFHILWETLQGDKWVSLPVNNDVLPSYYTRRGMSVRAVVCGFDGVSWGSSVTTEPVMIANALPWVEEAVFVPNTVYQNTDAITVNVVNAIDPDGDYIDFYYVWKVNGREVLSGYDNTTLERSSSAFTSGDVISCEITPHDYYGSGRSYLLKVVVKAVDTDGDGLPDDYNGNGRNDGNDDTDDDNDGYLDEWEEFMGTDPKNPSSHPLDTDGDGAPDGDSTNSQSWMDTDDDNDGFADSKDAFPLNPREWKDTDGDGIGDNSDDDIDGDGVPNWRDYDPYDPVVWKEPVKKESKLYEYMTLLILFLILLILLGAGYMLLTGRLRV